MSDDSKYLLVTTALEESFGSKENIIFLGEWCRLYSKKDIISSRSHKVLDYHWDDRNKAFNDFQYLSTLSKKITTDLTKTLNHLHGKNYSEKTLSILIGYWVIKFITVTLDRWSMIDIISKVRERYV